MTNSGLRPSGPFQITVRRVVRAIGCLIILPVWMSAATLAQLAGQSALPSAASPHDPSLNKPSTVSPADLADGFEKSAATIVAEVNGSPITLGMVADRLRLFPPSLSALSAKRFYELAVADLIQQRALMLKAKELGLDKDPETGRRIIEANDHELAAALIRHGTAGLITEKAIQDRYIAEIAGKPGPEEVQLRIITALTQGEAIDVLEQIKQGMGFAKAALEFSRDASKEAGGEIGYVRREKLSPEIGAVAFSLTPGETTSFPVKSNGYWFIIQSEGRRQQGAPSLAVASPQLKDELIWEATLEIVRKTRASVIVRDYGPSGAAGRTPQQ
jgi:peptidyl-prolyl cis-trans isomerase C